MEKIIKRDGKLVDFSEEKITEAIEKAGRASKEFDHNTAKNLAAQAAEKAFDILKSKQQLLKTMTVEEISEDTGRDLKDVLCDFLSSKTGKALYDDSTKLWCNGPSYIAELYMEERHWGRATLGSDPCAQPRALH